MKIQLTKPLINSPFNDNGSNIFKNIEVIYLDNINTKLVMKYYHYFRASFVKASLDFTAKNPRTDYVIQEDSIENKIEASQIALLLFDGSQEIIDKSNELLLKVCYKDENLKNRLSEIDLEQLDCDDWEALISNFLQSFWLSRWLAGTKTN
jgi:hypothetical protein